MKNLWNKYKELILYIFFGGATTAVNLIIYFVATSLLSLNPTGSNVAAWIGSVIFAFVTNKLFVFESKSWAPRATLREGGTFLASRLLSGILDVGLFELLMWLGLNGEFFGSEGFVAKILVNVVVIIVNYVLSKLIVFRKGVQKKDESEKTDTQ